MADQVHVTDGGANHVAKDSNVWSSVSADITANKTDQVGKNNVDDDGAAALGAAIGEAATIMAGATLAGKAARGLNKVDDIAPSGKNDENGALRRSDLSKEDIVGGAAAIAGAGVGKIYAEVLKHHAVQQAAQAGRIIGSNAVDDVAKEATKNEENNDNHIEKSEEVPNKEQNDADKGVSKDIDKTPDKGKKFPVKPEPDKGDKLPDKYPNNPKPGDGPKCPEGENKPPKKPVIKDKIKKLLQSEGEQLTLPKLEIEGL